MLLAHALMRLPMTSAAPAGSTMTAGSGDGGVNIGYIGADNPFGASPTGSLSPNPVAGFDISALADSSGIYLILGLDGDQVSALSGKKLVVDSAEYVMDTASQPPTYDGSSATTVAWYTLHGFVNGNSYTVNIV